MAVHPSGKKIIEGGFIDGNWAPCYRQIEEKVYKAIDYRIFINIGEKGYAI